MANTLRIGSMLIEEVVQMDDGDCVWLGVFGPGGGVTFHVELIRVWDNSGTQEGIDDAAYSAVEKLDQCVEADGPFQTYTHPNDDVLPAGDYVIHIYPFGA